MSYRSRKMKGGLYTIQQIQQLDAFDMDCDHSLHQTFIFNNRQRMDYIWVGRQIEYMNSLSDRDKHIIMSYTIYGDKLINNHIRGTLTPLLIENVMADIIKYKQNPFMYQHQTKTQTNTTEIDEIYIQNLPLYIEQFINEYNIIIQNAPSLTKKITIFRGLNDIQYILNGMQQNNTGKMYFHQRDFISSSFYLPASVRFMKDTCCMLELEVDTNVKCLLTGHISRRRGEFEITFAPNTIITNLVPLIKFSLEEFEHYESPDILIHPDNEEYEIRSINVYEGQLKMV